MWFVVGGSLWDSFVQSQKDDCTVAFNALQFITKLVHIAYIHEYKFVESWILWKALVMLLVFSNAIDSYHADVSKAIMEILE